MRKDNSRIKISRYFLLLLILLSFTFLDCKRIKDPFSPFPVPIDPEVYGSLILDYKSWDGFPHQLQVFDSKWATLYHPPGYALTQKISDSEFRELLHRLDSVDLFRFNDHYPTRNPNVFDCFQYEIVYFRHGMVKKITTGKEADIPEELSELILFLHSFIRTLYQRAKEGYVIATRLFYFGTWPFGDKISIREKIENHETFYHDPKSTEEDSIWDFFARIEEKAIETSRIYSRPAWYVKPAVRENDRCYEFRIFYDPEIAKEYISFGDAVYHCVKWPEWSPIDFHAIINAGTEGVYLEGKDFVEVRDFVQNYMYQNYVFYELEEYGILAALTIEVGRRI